jgi:hypothetical protein
VQFDQVRGEAEAGSKCEDLKSSPVRIGGFEMTSHTNFDPVLGQAQYTSSDIQYYHVSEIKQHEDWTRFQVLA